MPLSWLRAFKLLERCRFMFGISNTRYPVADVKLQYPDGAFYSLTRGVNNMWSAVGGPYTPPLTIQARSLPILPVHLCDASPSCCLSKSSTLVLGQSS